MQKMLQIYQNFLRHTAGTVLVAFALMAPVIVSSVGMALDYAQAYLVQQRLSQALDAAALAGATSGTTESEIQAKVNQFFAVNYPADKLGVTFDPEVTLQGDQVHVTGHAQYTTFFLNVIGITEIDITAENEITRSFGSNIELALVLDISGSMASNNKINDLKAAAISLIDTVVYDNQSEFYSKVAIVPYSVAVNVGSTYADQVRGPLTAAKTISGATKANPVVVTSSGHGFSNGDKVYIRNVSGMTQLNNKIYTVANKTNNTFQLSGVDGRNYSTYQSGGALYCTNPGCQYQYFQSPSGNWNTFQASTCVTERTGAYAYTDDPPSTAYVGRNYPASGNPCLSNKIVPLTNNKVTLESNINALTASGSTGGQVGVGWGWYMLSPEFGYLWPEESVPADYGAEKLHKIVVLMTDGEYNSPYCNGVISKDATSGSGSTADHINCNATNGNAYTQAEEMCDAMKADGKDIEIYTIGFRVDDYPRGEELMEYCATDAAHFYTADDGEELRDVFDAIANNVSSVYLSH